MESIVPSRRLLRHLGFACRGRPDVHLSRHHTRTTCHIHHRQNTLPRLTSPRVQTTSGHRIPTTRRASTSSTANASESEAAPSTLSSAAPLPDVTNHYTLFPNTLPHGPPPAGHFSISIPALRKEFLQIQSLHHPDKHPHEPAHSKALALSALINNAYKTLSDPLLRAQYLLLLKYDIDVMSEDNSHHSSAADSDTLMEVMDAQERIEDAKTQVQIEEIRAENATRIEETVQGLGDALERDDAMAATRECVRLKYWRSLADGLHSWEPGKEVRLVH